MMKKTILLFVCFTFLLVSVSAFVDKQHEAKIGETVPELILNQDDESITLSSMRGSWVLLSFWSAADAASRIQNSKLNNYAQRFNSDCSSNAVELVSVNFDRSEALMKQLVRADALIEARNYFEGNADNQQAMRNTFRMSYALRSFLIDPEGRIVIADPTDEQLDNYLSKHRRT